MTTTTVPTEEQRSYLSLAMDFGLIIRTDGTGAARVSDTRGITAPEEVQYVDLDADGRAPEPVAPAGWEYITGRSNQDRYDGAVFHPSEFIDGGLANHILTTPGYYVAVMIDGITERTDPDTLNQDIESIGWAILHYVGA